MNDPDFECKLDRLKQLSLEQGLRLTHQRLEILRELAAAMDHPSAEMIYKRVRVRMPTLSLDTVYRTLWTFERLGLAFRVPALGEQGRFDGDLSPHHHFVCDACSEIIDFTWDAFENIALPGTEAALGRIDRKQVVLRGLCGKCVPQAA
ncbi:MAG: transcriptional repressor [Desulfovibrionaceae bacterium]|nr:transcriptional repressor [Desulfovibrionaceae bacterium]MBF0513940.1 transcriptional repressor [Desulfovibrionaceae bacterium]